MNCFSCFVSCRRLVLLALVLLSTVSARAQVDIFLKFAPTNSGPQIVGDSTDRYFPGNAGWFVVKSFSAGVANPAIIGGAIGGGAGRASFIDFEVGKDVNKASPGIFQALATGQYSGFAQLVLRRPSQGGAAAGSAFLTYDFKTVLFTKQEWSAAKGDETAGENLQMVYGACRITFRPQNPDGSLGTAVTGQWNVINNTPTF